MRGKIIAGVISTVLILALLLVVGGRKEMTVRPKENRSEKVTGGQTQERAFSYSGAGNMSGNIENGGNQTWLSSGRILMNGLADDEVPSMMYFEVTSGTLRVACDKADCLHETKGCSAKNSLWFLNSYGERVFGVPAEYRKEVWIISGGETSCLYKAEEDILGMWCYEGYLYYGTGFGVYRISLEQPEKAVLVLEKPVYYYYLTFYKDKMYFCEEDERLYQAELDGSKKKRLLEEKILSPQIFDGKIYYRSAEYDKDGLFEMSNALYRVSLDGKKKEKILDGVYLFCMADEGIYFMELPGEEEGMLCFMKLPDGDIRKFTKCESTYLYVFEQTDWLVFQKAEGELPPGEEGGLPTHLYCIKKDGTQCRRLDYPKVLER